MKIQLDTPGMLSRWKLQRGLVPMTDSAAVTAETDPALDTALWADIERWYEALLREGPLEHNYPTELAGQTVLGEGTDGTVTLHLPDNAVRLAAVRLRGWECDARIVSAEAEPEVALMQRCAFSRATVRCPVAITRPGGFVTLSPAVDDNVPETLAVITRAEGVYRFDEAALPSPEIE